MMRDLRFARRAPKERMRIVCLGGSVTRAEYPFYMADYLGGEVGHPGVDPPPPFDSIELINSGFGGMGSTRVMLLMREILGYDPDLIVLSSGHNEFLERNFYRPLLERSPWLLRLQALFYRSTAARLARVALRALRDTYGGFEHESVSPLYLDMENRPFVDPRPTADASFCDPVLLNYTRNLLAMVEMARERGVALVLATLPTHLAVNSGFLRPYWPDPSRPPIETPWAGDRNAIGHEVDVAVALNLLAEGRAAPALSRIDALPDDLARHPMVPVWRAECLDSLGRGDRAWAARFEALRRTTPAGDRSLQNIAIRIAARLGGAPVIDVVRGMRRAGEAMGDPLHEFLWGDSVHPAFSGYATMGEAAARDIEAWWARGGTMPAAGSGFRPGPERDRRLRAALAAAIDPCAESESWFADPDPLIREAAAWGAGSPLCACGDRVLSRLAAAEADPGVRIALLTSAAVRAHPAAAALVLDALESDVEALHLAAIRAAGLARLEELAPELHARLVAPDASAAEQAELLWALGRIGSAPDPAPLRDFCRAHLDRGCDAQVAAAACFALGRIACEDAAVLLEAMLDHPHPSVVTNALWALAVLAGDGLRVVPGVLSAAAPQNCNAPPRRARLEANWHPQLATRVAGLVANPWPPIASAAVSLLARLPRRAGLEALLRHPELASREGVVELYLAELADLVGPADADALRRLARTAPAHFLPLLALVDPEAALALGGTEAVWNEWSVTVSRARAGDRDALERIHRDLREQTTPGAAPVGSHRPETAWQIEALGICGAESHAQVLRRILRDSRVTVDIQEPAATALGRIGDRAWLSDLPAVLPEGGLHLRIAVARALLRRNDETEVRDLFERSLGAGPSP